MLSLNSLVRVLSHSFIYTVCLFGCLRAAPELPTEHDSGLSSGIMT